MEIAAKQLLMSGVTSVVDLGGPLKERIAVRDRIKRGEVPGARAWVSGPWIARAPGSTGPLSFGWGGPVDTPEDAAEADRRLREEALRSGGKR